MAGPNSPIGSRRRLGAELRRLRNDSGLTLDDVAEQMTCSTSKISRLETGKGIPKVPDVRELMRIYGVTADGEQSVLLRLVHDGREHGWWEPLTDGVAPERYLLDSLARYSALENDATTVLSFDMTIVPGLLQTERYMRALMSSTLPHHSSAELDRLVRLRTTRQQALHRDDPPPLVTVALVDEAVLNRRVGAAAVMGEQLDYLLEASELPNVTVHVLPFDAGVHRVHAGHFALLEIPEALGSDVVFIESHGSDRFLDDQSDRELYREIHNDAVSRALTPAESRTIMGEYAAAYRSQRVLRRLD